MHFNSGSNRVRAFEALSCRACNNLFIGAFATAEEAALEHERHLQHCEIFATQDEEKERKRAKKEDEKAAVQAAKEAAKAAADAKRAAAAEKKAAAADAKQAAKANAAEHRKREKEQAKALLLEQRRLAEMRQKEMLRQAAEQQKRMFQEAAERQQQLQQQVATSEAPVGASSTVLTAEMTLDELVMHVLGSAHVPYRCLGVQQGATKETARKQYLALAIRLHPDKTDHPRAKAAFEAVEKAWQAHQ